MCQELNEIIDDINDAFRVKQSEAVGTGSIDGKHLELEEAFLLGLGNSLELVFSYVIRA